MRIVDDEQQFLRAAQLALRSEGFDDVITCADPRQALDLVREHTVNVVLLDIIMPHLSGREVLAATSPSAKLRATTPVFHPTSPPTREPLDSTRPVAKLCRMAPLFAPTGPPVDSLLA